VRLNFKIAAKVQKIFDICKNLIDFIKLIVRAERDKTFWRLKMVRNITRRAKKEQAKEPSMFRKGTSSPVHRREVDGWKPSPRRHNKRSIKSRPARVEQVGRESDVNEPL